MAKTLAGWLQVKDIEEPTALDANVVAMVHEKRDLEQLHTRIKELQNRVISDQIEIERLQAKFDERCQEINGRFVTDVRGNNHG